MTDKERLEEIKRQFNIIKSNLIRLDRNTNATDDYEWLIEQAERAQEYDKELISLEDNKHYVSEILAKNKRYQDLLKAITGLMETDARIYLTDKARLNGIHDALVEFYKED